MSTFIALLLKWAPAILHILGMLAVGVGANNAALATTSPAVNTSLGWPLLGVGSVMHVIGLIIGHRNTTVAKAELPSPVVAGTSTKEHLTSLLAAQIALDGTEGEWTALWTMKAARK